MTQVAIVGNLVADPDLRFLPKGDAVANFTIAENKRIKKGDEWTDGPSVFWRCFIWREAAENVAESLAKGMSVIARGEVVERSFETSGGEKRTVKEVEVYDIGPNLRRARAKVERQSGGSKPKPPADDPWGAPADGNWGNSADLEPPF